MKLKIVNKGRFITAIAILLFLICTALSVVKSVDTYEYEVVDVYQVMPGDTLWGICTQYRPDHMDIREYIYNVEQFNNCTADLQVGQIIKLIK